MKTILVTGVSSGLGRAMADEALRRGHRVVGTVRQEEQRRTFEQIAPGRSIGRLLDVLDLEAIRRVVQDVEAHVAPIDVVVNNAGYGLLGVMEELDLAELQRQFMVNVFAPVALIQAVLPAMRQRRSGHVLNVCSMGGVIAFPGLSAYHGSKFALQGMTDSLRQEVAALGIKVTAVLPGIFGSDWYGRSQKKAQHSIADYDPVVNAKRSFTFGDPAALGRVVLDAIEMDAPPEQLLVGPTAMRLIRARLRQWSTDIDTWEKLSEAGGEG